jgi:hypothetical protein
MLLALCVCTEYFSDLHNTMCTVKPNETIMLNYIFLTQETVQYRTVPNLLVRHGRADSSALWTSVPQYLCRKPEEKCKWTQVI